MCPFLVFYLFQDEKAVDTNVIGKREKARLREMEKLKKQKIQEIMTAQNAAIDADMVRYHGGFLLQIMFQFLFCGVW